MYQLQVPLGNLPINLVLLSNGTIAFVRVTESPVIVDCPEREGVTAIFSNSGFTLRKEDESEDFDYNFSYYYKNFPIMVEWLRQQNLAEPVVQFQ